MGAGDGEDTGLKLADAINELREQLALARSRATAAGLQFPVQSMTVELGVVATRDREGKAGFKVPVIDLELGGKGSHSQQATHRVSIEFGGPVDDKGDPVRVDHLSDTPVE